MSIESIHLNTHYARPVRLSAPQVHRRGGEEEREGPGPNGRVLRERGERALAQLDERGANALAGAETVHQRRILSERISSAREGLEARIANALAPFADDPDASAGTVADAASAGAGAEAAADAATGQSDRFARLRARLAAVEAEAGRAPFRDRAVSGGAAGGDSGDASRPVDAATSAEPGASASTEPGVAVADATRAGEVERRGDRAGVGRHGRHLRAAASAERNATLARLASALENAENGNQRRILSQRAGQHLGALQERLASALAGQRGTNEPEPTDPAVAGEGRDGDGSRVSDRVLLERIEAARSGLTGRVRNALATAETDDQRRFLTDAFTAAYADLESRIAHALREAGLFDEVADSTRADGFGSGEHGEKTASDDHQVV